jgi:hypothetical protein
MPYDIDMLVVLRVAQPLVVVSLAAWAHHQSRQADIGTCRRWGT